MRYSTKKINDICTIYDKLRKPISKKDRKVGIYPYYGASCIQDYVDDYLFDGRYVLIGEDGAKWSSGEETAYIAEGKFWVNNHAHIIKVNEDIVDTYVKYYFTYLDLTEFVAGAIIPKLTQETLKNIEIPIPPLSEQQRIVDILDAEFAKIDALKENAEKNLQNAKDLFQAVLRKELEPKEGWRQTSIGKVCVLKSGNSNANNSPVGSLPFVKVGDMNIKGNEEKITCSSNYVSYGENRKNIFPIGTIIFPKRGGAILTNKKRITAVEICCDLNIMGVYSLGKILPEYLYFHFLTVDLSKIYNGAAIPQINNGDISPLCISYPIEKKEQQKIIDKLILHKSNSMALHLNYEKTIALCNDMKQALLRKAFNGEM